MKIFYLLVLLCGWSAFVHAADPASGRTVHLAIQGMTCGHCSSAIQKALSRMPGVVTSDVSHASASAKVVCSVDSAPDAELVAAVERLGFKASVAAPPAAPTAP